MAKERLYQSYAEILLSSSYGLTRTAINQRFFIANTKDRYPNKNSYNENLINHICFDSTGMIKKCLK